MIKNLRWAQDVLAKYGAVLDALSELDVAILGATGRSIALEQTNKAREAVRRIRDVQFAEGWLACEDWYADPGEDKELVKPAVE